MQCADCKSDAQKSPFTVTFNCCNNVHLCGSCTTHIMATQRTTKCPNCHGDPLQSTLSPDWNTVPQAEQEQNVAVLEQSVYNNEKDDEQGAFTQDDTNKRNTTNDNDAQEMPMLVQARKQPTKTQSARTTHQNAETQAYELRTRIVTTLAQLFPAAGDSFRSDQSYAQRTPKTPREERKEKRQPTFEWLIEQTEEMFARNELVYPPTCKLATCDNKGDCAHAWTPHKLAPNIADDVLWRRHALTNTTTMTALQHRIDRLLTKQTPIETLKKVYGYETRHMLAAQWDLGALFAAKQTFVHIRETWEWKQLLACFARQRISEKNPNAKHIEPRLLIAMGFNKRDFYRAFRTMTDIVNWHFKIADLKYAGFRVEDLLAFQCKNKHLQHQEETLGEKQDVVFKTYKWSQKERQRFDFNQEPNHRRRATDARQTRKTTR